MAIICRDLSEGDENQKIPLSVIGSDGMWGHILIWRQNMF